ncbi:MAG: peptide-methionine (R)-S-oxide reductase, partial [Bryobacteraceae bacterium]
MFCLLVPLAGCGRQQPKPASVAQRGDAEKVSLVEFGPAGDRKGVTTVDKVVKTDEEWQRQLSREQYQVARQKGTERAFSGKYNKFYEAGIYRCVCCGNALFSSDTKFDSGTGWPS